MLNVDDRYQIAETLALHAYVSDENELDRLDELFVNDAVYDMSGSGMEVLRGIDSIRAAATRMSASGRGPVAHLVTNVMIAERDSVTADVRSRCLMIMRDGQVRVVSYRDTLSRQDGRWLISHRVITPLHPAPAAPQPR